MTDQIDMIPTKIMTVFLKLIQRVNKTNFVKLHFHEILPRSLKFIVLYLMMLLHHF